MVNSIELVFINKNRILCDCFNKDGPLEYLFLFGSYYSHRRPSNKKTHSSVVNTIINNKK